MKFPDSTYFNRKLPKQRFYENLTISAATKKSFVDQIKSIYWENKISADTINIAAENKVTEIEIAWWAYQNDKQPLLSLETTFEIEHIYARNRNEKENSLSDARNVESLGNKALLEKRINIRASDYRFADKKKYYQGFTNSKGQVKEGTGVIELLDMTATSADFTEKDIIDRYKDMIDCFINYLQQNNLLK